MMSAIEDDDIDETVLERLYGLTEMFPDCVRNASYSVIDGTIRAVKAGYQFSRNSVWVTFTSSIVLFGPIWVEIERSTIEKELQRQLLLGPRG